MPTVGNSITGSICKNGNPAPRNRTLFLTQQDRAELDAEIYRIHDPAKIRLRDAVNRVTCGDSLAILPALPDGCIDLVVADPPYNVGKSFGPAAGRCRWTHDEYTQYLRQWLSQCARLLREGGSLYVCCDWRFSGMVHSVLDELLTVRNRITWRREKGRGCKRNWKNNLEDIFFATKGEEYTFNTSAVMVRKKVVAPYRREDGSAKDWREEDGERVRYTHPSNIWTDLVVPFWSMPENTPHPAQKPERLIERIILASSDPGQLVLDPFLGSGTSAVVARRLGRSYIGIECNEDYCRLAIKRLARERS